MPAWLDAIHTRPARHRMIVQSEESAPPRHVEPAVVVDLHAPHGRVVVLGELRDHSQQAAPAEILQLLYAGLRRPEQLEIALEDLGVALREGSRVRVFDALRLALQE